MSESVPYAQRFHFAEPPTQRDYKPMIISVALTGAVPSKERYPNLPTTPVEIANQALECAEIGASVAHIHVRDADGKPTHSVELLAEIVSLIRKENPELILCATTTSRGSSSLKERLSPFSLQEELLPDLASLTIGSYNTPTGANINPQAEIIAISAEMVLAGVRPEAEIFEPGMLYQLNRLVSSNLIPPPAIVNILLGIEGASPASARELVHMVDLVPPGIEWAVAGIGRFQKNTTILGALMGGNVRVGMEDDPRGEDADWTNQKSVKRACQIGDFVGRPIEDPVGARKRLGLPTKR